MPLPVWGNLEKSQIDAEKIEEAIARLIQAHEDDPNAHIEVGESLQSHKVSEIIDHVVASIIADKIKDGIISAQKMTRDNYLQNIDWDSLDGWDQVIDAGGAITPYLVNVSILTNNVNGEKAGLRSFLGLREFFVEGKEGYVEWTITENLSNANVTIWLFVASDYNVPPDEAAFHVGFKIVNGDIFATNADFAAQKMTDTGENLITGIQYTRLRIELVGTSTVKFYINDVLKVTHTDNVPPTAGNTGTGAPEITLRTDENAAKRIRLGHIVLQKEY